MSRIGKKLVTIPTGVIVTIENHKISVKGPKGSLDFCFDARIRVEKDEDKIKISPVEKDNNEKAVKALWGLTRSLIQNNVIGVAEGFIKQLEIQGVGYRAQLQGRKLILELGFSHSIEYLIPEGITIQVNKNIIEISGIDKQKVGQVAAELRALRPPEPYKGKGIRYVGEQVRRKVGKKAAAEEGGGGK